MLTLQCDDRSSVGFRDSAFISLFLNMSLNQYRGVMGIGSMGVHILCVEGISFGGVRGNHKCEALAFINSSSLPIFEGVKSNT